MITATKEQTMITGTLTDTGKTYGTHGSRLMIDSAGKKFLVKFQDEFRSHLDVAIAKLQQVLGITAPRVELTVVSGQTVAAHEWISGEEIFSHWNFDATALNEAQAERLTVELAFDWLISNHDSHPGQFIATAYGLIGLDKGQAFKHVGRDELSADYHPNAAYGEAEPVYNAMKRTGMLRDSAELQRLFAAVENLTDEFFVALLADYVRTCSFVQAEKFNSLALARKANLRQDVTDYLYS